jgi:hypothetical protein
LAIKLTLSTALAAGYHGLWLKNIFEDGLNVRTG